MVNAKKLFFVINSLHGGGAERVLSNLANFFFGKGYEVTIVCLNRADPAYDLCSGIKIVSLVSENRDQRLFYRMQYGIKTFFKMLGLLNKEKPVCVVSFMTSANLWSGLTCGLLNIPYLVSERITPDQTVNQFSFYLQWLSAVVYGKSKAIVVPSKGMIGGFTRERSFSRLRNFEVINNPVNQFECVTERKVHNRKFILGVGRLDTQKGFDLLISAFKQLELEGIDLLISGEGKERKHLERLIDSLELGDSVKLIGHKKNLQDYYLQAEFFVLSSRNEGYPNVLIEAMSLGCACIATNCEFGPSDIIENEQNGLLIRANDVTCLYNAIQRLMADPLLKAKISHNAKKINHTNSPENTYAKWERLILSHI
ncbi:MAG TPA: glycosyltransferase family 4 protein [Pedobacter sp.]|nr:glycosyltransferase family 4 protein [Pedobacter sp.]